MRTRVGYASHRIADRIMSQIAPHIDDCITQGNFSRAQDACYKVLKEELAHIDEVGIQIEEDKRSFKADFWMMDPGDHV
jgi:hypothetical protein